MAGHGKVVIISSKAEWDAALSGAANDNKAVIVDFTATWCGPCRMIGPVFVELSTKYTTVLFLKVDVDEVAVSGYVDEVAEVAEACKISAMPTFQVFKGKAKVDELVGANPPKLEELIKKYA